jgi:hypothetical protein
MKLVPALLIVAALAGTARADDTPVQRGEKLIAAQIAALNGGAKAYAATFDDAVVIVETDSVATGAEDLTSSLDQTGGALSPTPINGLGKAKKKKVLVGGTADAIWIAAELTLTGVEDCEGCGYASHTKYSKPYRITELVANDGGAWKVKAALLSLPTKSSSGRAQQLATMLQPTTPGPLAALLTSPTALAAALAKDASVVVWGTGPSEAGFGQAGGRKLLKKWKNLQMTIDGDVREVTTKTYGFVQANVDLAVKGEDHPVRMRALLVAVPDAAVAGGWSVVSVHYSSTW